MLCSSVSLWHSLEKLQDLLLVRLPLVTNTAKLIVDARFCRLEAAWDASCVPVFIHHPRLFAVRLPNNLFYAPTHVHAATPVQTQPG